MKFKFVNSAKKLNPADISAKMNFGKVAQSAKALSSAKLAAGALKLGSTTLTTVATTTAVVVTATVVGITNPDLFQFEEQEDLNPIEEVFEPELPQEQAPVFLTEETERTEEEEVKPIVKKKTVVREPTLEPQVEEPSAVEEEPNENVEFRNPAAENIFIQPRPLPSMAAFYSFIGKELTYPIEYLEDPIEGNVRLWFTIDKEGKAVNFKIKKSLGLVFDQEAIRVLKKYQNWQPASLNGQAVEYNMDISIRFETK